MKYKVESERGILVDKLFNADKFGEKLKKYRIKNHLSQMELAEKIGSATSSVSHLENGTHSPSLETLLRLSQVLNIGIDEMLYDSLPSVKDYHLDKDIQKLFSGCSADEKELLIRILETVKKTLRERK